MKSTDILTGVADDIHRVLNDCMMPNIPEIALSRLTSLEQSMTMAFGRLLRQDSAGATWRCVDPTVMLMPSVSCGSLGVTNIPSSRLKIWWLFP